MKKIIVVVLGVVVVGVCGFYILGFVYELINEVPEDWLLVAGVWVVGTASGLLIGLPLRAFFRNVVKRREERK